MFNFTPLLGARASSPASQSLLEFEGGIKILVDVGWDVDFDVSKLKALESHVSTLSIILLTHATPAHLAAFAHCCKHFPLFAQIPIYATTPVISLGRTLLQDIYSSTPLASSIIPSHSLSETVAQATISNGDKALQLLLQPPTAEEIASYFALINPLKYSQPHQPLPSSFSPPLNGLTITAYNAGHSLGGTIWHIQHGMESVVYAVDWNQVRENVFSGAAWLGSSGAGGAEVIEQLRKPTALICSTKGVEKIAYVGGRTKRDELMLDMIKTTIARGGTVLIPTDASGRVLELAYLLDTAWGKEANNSEVSLQGTKLYLASTTIGATMRYARSMVEWMDENVVREFEAQTTAAATRQPKRTPHRNNQGKGDQATQADNTVGAGPFDFKFVKLLERRSQIEKILSNKAPKVILASDTSLAWGFSKDVLLKIAADTSNLIILTEDYGTAQIPHQMQTIGRTLWEWYQERKDGVAMDTGTGGQHLEQVYSGGRDLVVVDPHRTLLAGKELLIYQQYLATQRQLQTLANSSSAIALESSADAIDENSSSSSSSSDESDPEHQGKALNFSATLTQANKHKLGGGKEILGVNVLLREPGVYDYDVRGKKGREALFPFATKRRRADDFGELIRPEDYLRAEERDEIDGQDLRDAGAGKNNSLGQKRKWEDPSLQHNMDRRSSLGAEKRRKIGEAGRFAFANDTATGNQTNGNGAGGNDDSDDSESDIEELPVGPSKLTYQTSTIQVNLRIAYVDFAGLHDQRSLSMLIPLIQPRKIVLVGGTESETAWLAAECHQKIRSRLGSSEAGIMDDIFSPANGETVSASMDTHAWTVKLSEALVKRFHWQNVKGLGVVTLMGRLSATEVTEQPQAEVTRRKRQKLVKDDSKMVELVSPTTDSKGNTELPPTLDILPASMVATTRSVAQPLHVGDLRLADLRKALQNSGHTAEFRGEGTLVIDGLVAVRKSATGQIVVEGGGLRLPEYNTRDREASFHAVKRRIYEGLAVIAGG